MYQHKHRLMKFNPLKLFRRDDPPDKRLCEYLKESSFDEQDGLSDKVSINHNPVASSFRLHRLCVHVPARARKIISPINAIDSLIVIISIKKYPTFHNVISLR